MRTPSVTVKPTPEHEVYGIEGEVTPISNERPSCFRLSRDARNWRMIHLGFDFAQQVWSMADAELSLRDAMNLANGRWRLRLEDATNGVMFLARLQQQAAL